MQLKKFNFKSKTNFAHCIECASLNHKIWESKVLNPISLDLAIGSEIDLPSAKWFSACLPWTCVVVCVVNLCVGRAVRHVRPSLDALYSSRRQIWNTPNGNKAASLVSAAMRFVTNNERKAPRGTRARRLSPSARARAEIYGSPKQAAVARLLYFYLRNVDSRRRLFLNTLRASESRSYDFNSRRPSCPAAAHNHVPRGPGQRERYCDLLSRARSQLSFQQLIYRTGNYFFWTLPRINHKIINRKICISLGSSPLFTGGEINQFFTFLKPQNDFVFWC